VHRYHNEESRTYPENDSNEDDHVGEDGGWGGEGDNVSNVTTSMGLSSLKTSDETENNI